MDLAILENDFDYPVVVHVPANGCKNKTTFTATFKMLPDERVRELLDAQRNGQIKDADFVREVLVNVKGLKDGGDAAEFDSAALERITKSSLLNSSIVKAFFRAIDGEPTKI